jgi:hypothetical protein
MPDPVHPLSYEEQIEPETIRVEPADSGAVVLLPARPAREIRFEIAIAFVGVVLFGGWLAIYLALTWGPWRRPLFPGDEFRERFSGPALFTLMFALPVWVLVLRVGELLAWRRGVRSPRRQRVPDRHPKVGPQGPSVTFVDVVRIPIWAGWPRYPGWAIHVTYGPTRRPWNRVSFKVDTRREQAEAVAADLRRVFNLPESERNPERP